MGIWDKKSIKTLLHDSENAPLQLKRTLGPFDLILLGIGVILGAGLFSITGIAAAEYAGPAVLISFIIAAFGCMLAGLCYSELASMIPISGSAYTFAYVTMGELVAWLIGWSLILEYAVGAATVSISWSAYFVSLFNDFNISLPYQLVASPWHPTTLPDGTLLYGWINLPALLIVVFTSMILIKGMKESAMMNAIFVIIKVAIILVFISAGINFIHMENLQPFIPENSGVFGEFGWSGILRASGVIFFAYIGFDCLSTAAQETINPQKNMPIGILGSLGICTVLYILFTFVMLGLVSYKELNVAAPVAIAIEKTPYQWLHELIKIAILTGFTSVILVCLMGQSRLFYAMARDGMLPKKFAALHPKLKTPYWSNLILMVFVSVLGAFAPMEVVAHMTSIGTLLAFVIVCCGVLILRYRHPEYPRPFKVPFSPWVPLLGAATCLMMMASLNLETWGRLVIWMAIGLMIYLFYSHRHIARLAHEKMEESDKL